jgi:uncharacterized protein YndB with AHSA1/START domain
MIGNPSASATGPKIMLKIIAIVAVVVVVAVIAVLALAATRPDVFRVQRSASIKAPPEKVFPLINDYKQWAQWSPYETRDPAMKRTFSGPPAGKGAIYAWEGDKNVGSGRMEIVEVAPPTKVTIKLDFIKPFEAHNIAEFTLAPQGDATTVTWAMHGPTPFFGKVLHLFLDMDKMVGTDFATGLANMKALAEK